MLYKNRAKRWRDHKPVCILLGRKTQHGPPSHCHQSPKPPQCRCGGAVSPQGAIWWETIMVSGLRRNAIPQWGFARMPLLSATQPLECHPREFRAFYSPSTPPFSLLLSRSRLGRTEREPRTDRALGLFSSVTEVPFRNCCHRGHRNSDSKMKFMLDTVAMSKHKMCHF